MSPVGPYLRDLRERRGVSIEEIARTTRVGRGYLEALEAGDLSQLPAPVFTRGFVLAYCEALGESPDEALALYKGRASSPEEVAPPPLPERERATPTRRGPVLVSFVLLVVLGAALFAVASLLQTGREPPPPREARLAEPLPAPARADGVPPAMAPAVPAAGMSAPGTAVPVPGTLAAPPTPSPKSPGADVRTPEKSTVPPGAGATPAPAPATPAVPTDGPPRPAPTARPAPDAPPAAAAAPAAAAPSAPTPREIAVALGPMSPPYRLVARTTAPTWLRVRTGDGRQSDETIPAGQVREWVSDRPFTVSIGNAGGIRLELNGQTLPALGGSGAVVSRLLLPPETP